MVSIRILNIILRGIYNATSTNLLVWRKRRRKIKNTKLEEENWIPKEILFKYLSTSDIEDKRIAEVFKSTKNLYSRKDLNKLTFMIRMVKGQDKMPYLVTIKNCLPKDNDLNKLKANLNYCFYANKNYRGDY